jgi:ATP-dependent Lon protease
VPRQVEECGLTADRVQVSRAAIREVISGYTQEAGVRGLERELGRLLRKIARRIAEGETQHVSVSLRNLRASLGPAPLLGESIPRTAEAGLARGLAWTETGGEVLVVEATMVRGRGLILTGQLGDVMKESAQAALSYVRWRGSELGIAEGLAKHEIHVHVPAGATPKDGPSAGITMATAMVSLLTGIPVRSDLTMTGEVTLRGRVLPVGGVREKVLAALRRGLRHVILPEANQHDLEDVPPELARKLEFHFVNNMDEVLELALAEPILAKRRPRRAPARTTPAIIRS